MFLVSQKQIYRARYRASGRVFSMFRGCKFDPSNNSLLCMPHEHIRLRVHLHCQCNVTQFRFFALMWHRSDMLADSVIRKKTHAFGYFEIGYRPHSYVEINQICIGYVPMRPPCKQADRIFLHVASLTSSKDHLTYFVAKTVNTRQTTD